MDLVYLSQNHNLKDQDVFLNKYFSKKLGVISHYLADYTCYPHAKRIRCSSRKTSMEHLQYEKDLNLYLNSHDFLQVPLETMDLEAKTYLNLLAQVKEYIHEAIKAYEKAPDSYGKDLNFALTLNKRVTDGILTCEDPITDPVFQAKKSSFIPI